jgi:magnesium transporter
MPGRDHFQETVERHMRRDVSILRRNLTVGGALEAVRRQGLGERIVYFYVVDDADRLVGVVPVRRLLTAALEQTLEQLMLERVVAVPHTATVLEVCELFALHRYLALPVVDDERRVVGAVDVDLFTGEVLDLAERDQVNEVFESIGVRVSEVRDASPWVAFRFRFPWLLATVAGGTACALIAGRFEATLAETLILAFFLTLVLGLAESVGVQSMTVTVRALHRRQPTLRWFSAALGRELGTALLLGASCGAVVGSIAWLWRSEAPPAVVIAASIALAMTAASLYGLSVPTLLHALRLDPKIAAGPITLALTDITTLLLYLTTATWLL